MPKYREWDKEFDNDQIQVRVKKSNQNRKPSAWEDDDRRERGFKQPAKKSNDVHRRQDR